MIISGSRPRAPIRNGARGRAPRPAVVHGDVDVRILPFEARDRTFDRHLPRGVVAAPSVVRDGARAPKVVATVAISNPRCMTKLSFRVAVGAQNKPFFDAAIQLCVTTTPRRGTRLRCSGACRPSLARCVRRAFLAMAGAPRAKVSTENMAALLSTLSVNRNSLVITTLPCKRDGCCAKALEGG